MNQPANVLTGPTAPVSIPNLVEGILMGNVNGIPNIDTTAESLTSFLNLTLIPMLLTTIMSQKYAPITKTTFKKKYDYVIVGAGAAGSVLANRLSEEECASVLLLEAGKSPPVLSEIPGIARALLLTDANWNYLSVPQKYTAAQLYNNQIPFSAGKAVGGSSIVNAMLFIRGNRQDYDDWEEMGAKGWSWKDVYPYFLKLENNTDPDLANNGYHNVSGPLTCSRIRYTPELKKPILEGAKSLGFDYGDPNAAEQLGFSDFQTFIRHGQRCSTAKAYLVPVDDRPNLDIVSEAFVKKVRICHKKARGVHFDYKGHSYYVKANKEVILAAGAISTPQIMMLSGIGPKETLDKFKIPVHADLKVGHNLQDHVTAIMHFSIDPPYIPYIVKILNPVNILEYATNRSGPLASATGVFQLGFDRSSNAATAKDVPNYESYFIEGANLLARLTFGLKPLVYEQLFLPYELSATMWCFSSIMNPKSTGTVTIGSTSPYDQPLIDPMFLKDPQDLKDIVAGMKTCLRVARTEPVQKAGVKPFQTLMPGCEKYADDEDKYLECYAKSYVFTIAHQSCTTKMGDPNHPDTVVDPELNVIGIKNLRVVGASVMPKVVSGNTMVPTVMIAEKASDIIKKTISC